MQNFRMSAKNARQTLQKYVQKFAINGRVSKSLSGRREFTGNCRINILIVIIGVAMLTNTQAKALHCLRTDDLWQPFIIRDVLEFGNYDTLSF